MTSTLPTLQVATKKPKQSTKASIIRRDVILPMQEPYMQQIVTGMKTYEFRKYLINRNVERIWFYRTAPHSSIEYICEILPARTRTASDEPLDEDGSGNKEYNERHGDYDGYDYAYSKSTWWKVKVICGTHTLILSYSEILSVYKLGHPITLAELRETYEMKSAPRGLVYTPQSILDNVSWKDAEKLR